MHSTKDNKCYIKYKTLVRKWEKEFTTKNSRLPSKYDIKEAPEKVRYAYKQYFNMKSAALEESIFDGTPDERSVSGSPEFPPLADSMFDFGSSISDFPIADLPSTSELEILLATAKKSPQLKVSKYVDAKQTTLDKPKSNTNNISENVSKKLFEKSKFSLRNPRKSSSFQLSKTLSENKTECTKNIDINTECTIDSKTNPLTLSNIHDTKFNLDQSIELKKGCKENVELPPPNSNVTCTSVMNIDLGWLERSSGIKPSTYITEPGAKSNTKHYGLRNINYSVIEKKSQSDYVENSESETDDICSSTLKPALKKRKLNNRDAPEVLGQISASNDDNSSIILKNISEKNSRKTRTITKRSSKKEKNLPTIKESSPEPPVLDDYISIDAEKDLIPRFDKESSLYAIDKSTRDINQPETSKCTDRSAKIEQKINNGTINENFVKINMKKKIFVRGKKSFNYSKFKKKEWKNKNSLINDVEFPEGGKSVCFKCGKAGHMSRYCTAHREDALLPLEASSTDDTPTLSEMENKIINEPENNNEIHNLTKCATSVIPDSFLELLSQSSADTTPTYGVIKPIYSPDQTEITNEVQESLEMFGHKNFRSGQKETVMRILSGLSTLLVLSTGSGKSLCYQLPAYIFSKYYTCVTLVISPLVSLMDDQVLSMPEFLKAGCLHTNQTLTQRKKILELLKNGQLNILLISPEALISGERNSGMGNLFKNMPPIAFACIDEVHCVSQWSHNFRPSYLMICRVLREKLKVNCILGLTATASQPTIRSIIDHLNICDGSSGVINNPTLPQNLMLSVSFEKDKDRSLVSILSSEPFSNYNSIIIYCIRRDECERVASMLRSTLQEPGKITTERGKKRKRMSYTAETYHAGMTASQRRKIQDNFMNGSLKIIVATVAFGMGINKSDIRCIIHYNMPKSFESYVQEIGRAGRDGKSAHCHVFMNNDNNDKNELLRHIYSNNIDRHIIRKLLQKVFVPCDCKKNFAKVGLEQNRCKGHEVAFPVDSTVEELDIPSENISTLLCYLELHPKKYIQILNNCYTMCKIYSYGGPEKLIQAAKTCPPLAMAYTLCGKSNNDVTTMTTLDFPVIDVAAAIGWESGVVKYHLKNLEWTTINGNPKRSTIKVELHTLGFRVRASGDLTPSEMDEMLDDLHKRVSTQEEAMLYQLQEINEAFIKVGKTPLHKLFNLDSTTLEQQSNELKEIIKKYFLRDNVINNTVHINVRPINEERAVSDIRALISAYKDCKFNGKSVARIFQGISSPNFPALVWGRCKFWRSHIHEDFHGLAKLATQEIISMH